MPAVVFLHEGAGSGALWERSASELTSTRQVISYDRRGYGRSPRDAVLDERHFDQAVADLAELVRSCAAGPVDLVGHSDGGSIALLLAAREPLLVRSVVVVATHVFADPVTVAAVRALGSPDHWDERTRSRYERLHGPDWEDVVSGWLRLWTGGLSQWDMRSELPGITAPVLAVHDRDDPLSPAIHAELLHSLVPHCRVSWYETGTHRPHLVDPGSFRADVHELWKELSS